jgi:Predicted permeases
MHHFAPSTLWLGFLLATFGTALFSLKSIFIKLAYAEGLNTDSVLMLRMAIALPIYLAILIWLARTPGRHPHNRWEKFGWIFFLGFIGYFLSSWLDLKGLEMITAQLERLTLFTYPILVAILGALFFKTPITRNVFLSLVTTYAGLWIVFYQEQSFGGEATLMGTLLVFLAALSFSFYVLFSKKIIHQVGSLWFTSMAMSVSSGFVLGYFGLFVGFDGLTVSPMAWLWLILLAIVSTVIPSFMIAEAIALIGPSQTGIIGTLEPIVTIGLAVWWLNEPFSVYHAIGIALVISGVLVLTVNKGRKTSS